jgi:hypothetical protein
MVKNTHSLGKTTRRKKENIGKTAGTGSITAGE